MEKSDWWAGEKQKEEECTKLQWKEEKKVGEYKKGREMKENGREVGYINLFANIHCSWNS